MEELTFRNSLINAFCEIRVGRETFLRALRTSSRWQHALPCTPAPPPASCGHSIQFTQIGQVPGEGQNLLREGGLSLRGNAFCIFSAGQGVGGSDDLGMNTSEVGVTRRLIADGHTNLPTDARQMSHRECACRATQVAHTSMKR